MTLIPLNPQTLAQHAKATQEIAVSTYLERAKEWLATAVEITGPEHIAEARAHLRSVDDFSRNFDLSKDIQRDATEMVRRSEYELARAIRKGRIEGTVRTNGGDQYRSGLHVEKTGISDFVSGGQEHADLNTLSTVPPADFDAAIDEAKAEGNLSRANVVRKAREKSGNDVAPKPTKPRKPLPDVARNAGWDLRKAVERLERIAADDRFASNKEQVASHLRSHLLNAVEVCQDLLVRIDN